MNIFSKSDLIDAVAALGAGQAVITTLVVKNYLRSKGLVAVQDQVSAGMHALADEGILEKMDNGRYHEFWMSNNPGLHWSTTKNSWVHIPDMDTAYILNALMRNVRQLGITLQKYENDKGLVAECELFVTELFRRK
jgi:hypothetical protein